MPETRAIFNCDGVRIGYIVENEHGGSFFVQEKRAMPHERVNYGVNANHLRQAFKNTDPGALRRAFA